MTEGVPHLAAAAVVMDAVSKRYGGQTAVSEVGFALPEGAMLALLGHNGAGKTTLMKLILGLVRPSCGSVTVLGTDPAAAGTGFRRQLGFLPENVAFHDEMTGRATLRFLGRLKGEGGAAGDALLERVGLAQAADRRIKTYSKGMRQRLGLAQALLGRPRILLLDEPTAGLDPALRLEFFEIVNELRRGGTTVVLSSHILSEVEARTELVAIMRRGRLAAWGSLAELRREARLPIRIRLAAAGDPRALAERLTGLAIAHVNEHSVELTCSIDDKMVVLRHVAALADGVADMDVHLPSLDDIYIRFGAVTDEGGAP